jgi:predicted  nucleic acid-binding Zn-ribbon protein
VTEDDPGIRERISRQGEEALGRIAEELAGNPLVVGALSRAFEAREKATQAQEAAMGALGIPSAADIERLTRRLRSVSQRLESIEDSVDRLDERLESIERGVGGLDERLGELSKATAKPARASRSAKAGAGEGDKALDARLDEIARDIAALRAAVAPGEEPPPRAQERLTVSSETS